MQIIYFVLKEACSVWDWTRKKKISSFYNGNPRGTTITGLHIINQEVGAMILAGSGMYSSLAVYSIFLFCDFALQPRVSFDYIVIMLQTSPAVRFKWSARSEV
jgi:hypothetical protein